LQDLADAIYPPSTQDKIKEVHGQKMAIKLGAGNYINRLIAFIEEKSASDNFKAIVGSHLEYIVID